jgi:hypothetical protein
LLWRLRENLLLCPFEDLVAISIPWLVAPSSTLKTHPPIFMYSLISLTSFLEGPL